jgi:hypothetical protein
LIVPGTKRAGACLGGEGAGFPFVSPVPLAICKQLPNAAESRVENYLIENTLQQRAKQKRTEAADVRQEEAK